MLRLTLALVLCLAATSCATITRGSKDTLVINTTPAGAHLELSNGLVGTSPASFKLPRKSELIIKITKEGYEPAEVNITPQISGGGGAGMAGNVLLGGLIGAAVDAGSGSMYDLKPNPVEVALTPIPGYHPEGTVPEAQPSDLKAKLLELKGLLDDGLLTEEEYETARANAIEAGTL